MAKKKAPAKKPAAKKPAARKPAPKPVPKGYIKKGNTLLSKEFLAKTGDVRHHELALQSAKALWAQGVKTGKVWGGIIDVIGYDPRQGGKLVFQSSIQPGTPGSAATPGVPSPTMSPFLTPDQQITQIDFEGDIEEQLANLDNALEGMRIDNEFQKTELDTAHKQQVARADESAIGRGLYTSSIRDAELNDLEATKRVRSSFLDTQFSVAQANAGATRERLRQSLDQLHNAMNQQGAQNASNASEDAAPYSQEPQPARPGTPSRIVRTPAKKPVVKPTKPKLTKPRQVASFSAPKIKPVKPAKKKGLR